MDVIAERFLTFRRNGTDVDESVVVRLGRPHVGQYAPAYTTPVEIVGPDGYVSSRYSVGEDSMQSLALVYVLVHALLDGIKREGSLTWNGDEDLGIPSGK